MQNCTDAEASGAQNSAKTQDNHHISFSQAALNMPPRMLLELCKTMSNQGDPMYSYNLGAMLHGASGDPTLPLDLPGSAEAYARCVTQVRNC